MVKLSVVVITLNEEENIGRCLESVSDVADEILVVDSLSTDTTREICESHGARFVEQKFLGYVEQKNFALDLATHEHVLSLDADEALSPELRAEILRIKADFQQDGYRFNRLTRHSGHWVRHCGWYPDAQVRLFRKSKTRWVGTNPHDHAEVSGSVAHIAGDLFHYSFDSVSSHVKQADHFTSIEARALISQGKRGSLLKLVSGAPLRFCGDYFLKLGILDGRHGLVICSLNGLYVLLTTAKMMELERQGKL